MAAKHTSKNAADSKQEDDASIMDMPPPDDAMNGEDGVKKRKLEEENGHQSSNVDETTIPLPGISQEDLQIAVRVLNEVGKLNKKRAKKNDQEEPSGLDIYKSSTSLRPLRKALAGCLELQRRSMYGGKQEEEHYEERIKMRSIKRQKESERHHQRKYIESTNLRKGRMDKLRALQNDAQEEELAKLQYLVPDGHVETGHASAGVNLLENGSRAAKQVEDDQQKKAGVTVETVEEDGGEDDAPKKLPAKPRSCYVCKVRYRELHSFYDQLCPSCAALNWEKRHQTCDMTNKVAIVTGSRVKIGYQTCLKLLRAGATVVATTRFPNAAAATYRQEPDFDKWKGQLQIYGLDLRDVTGLEAFTRYLKQSFENGIDVIVNNACQTVRRPRGYYIPIVEKEQQLWQESDEVHKSLLEGCVAFERVRRKLFRGASNGQAMLDGGSTAAPTLPMPIDEEQNGETQAPSSGGEIVEINTSRSIVQTGQEDDTTPFETSGLSHSAAMSQLIMLPEDAGVSDSVLPPGLSDINGQQLDLRKTNSWLLKMEEVSTPEIMECMFINAIAPFVLNSRLKPLMAYPPDDDSRPDRYIINVSAMEGKFYRYKMPNHPHTNMAKAALNMMTRTSAEDLATEHRIYMNAVDTGWINDENPLEKASKIAEKSFFQTPIDEIDAAARILDPVFTGVNDGREAPKDYGKFLKDYRESEW